MFSSFTVRSRYQPVRPDWVSNSEQVWSHNQQCLSWERNSWLIVLTLRPYQIFSERLLGWLLQYFKFYLNISHDAWWWFALFSFQLHLTLLCKNKELIMNKTYCRHFDLATFHYRYLCLTIYTLSSTEFSYCILMC